MKKWINLILGLACLAGVLALAGSVAPGVLAEGVWGEPAVVWPDDARYHSIDDSGTVVVALLPYTGTYDNPKTRDIAVVEKAGGVWGAPVVIASNGLFDHSDFQWLPQMTHPVISGDGQTIVYVGYNPDTETDEPFMVKSLPGGGWSAPMRIYTEETKLPNTHYWISLSQDGQTLALSNYPFLGDQHVYVLTRSGDTWSAPLQVSSDDIQIRGGGMPHLSADGNSLVYVQNMRLMFTEFVDGTWQAPVQLTDNDPFEYHITTPQMSFDGQSIYYWYEKIEIDVRVEMDLYVIQRNGIDWGAPQKVTTNPTAPLDSVEAPPTANAEATRFIYRRPFGDWEEFLGEPIFVYHSAHLEMAEWRDGAWHITQVLQATNYSLGDMNQRPRLTPDGQTVIFKGGNRQNITGGLWEMQTETVTPPLNAPIITTANNAQFTVGMPGSFSVGAIGDPIPTITLETPHPAWISLADHGDGTATLSGTPPEGSGGIYTLLITAANGLLPNATQEFTLTVSTVSTIGSDGGTITSNDGQLVIGIPANSVPEGTEFNLIPQVSPTPGTGNLYFGGTSFVLTSKDELGNPLTVFNPPLEITIQYDPASLGAIAEESLMLYKWQTSTQTWLDAACTPYDREVPNQFTVGICNLSEFAVLGSGSGFNIFLPLILH